MKNEFGAFGASSKIFKVYDLHAFDFAIRPLICFMNSMVLEKSGKNMSLILNMF